MTESTLFISKAINNTKQEVGLSVCSLRLSNNITGLFEIQCPEKRQTSVESYENFHRTFFSDIYQFTFISLFANEMELSDF